MRSIRRPAKRLAAACLAIAAGGAMAAAVAAPFLPELRGERVTVLYSPGALDRAVRVQERFELLAADTAGWSRRPAALTLRLLAPEDWEGTGVGVPYGLPARLADGSLALPAWGTAETVALWRRLLGGALPALTGSPLRGTPDEAASLAAADLAAEAEAARSLLATIGLRGESAEIDALLAHLLAVSAFWRHEGARLPQIDAFFGALEWGGSGAGASGGADAGLEAAARRLAEEARLYETARRIASEAGGTPARPLLKQRRKAAGPVTAAELEKLFPGLPAGWDRPQASE